MSDDSSSTIVLAGACQCRAVRFAACTESKEAYYCHCRMCQLAFGNIHATFFNVKKRNVSWSAGPPAYYHSSKIARRGFCAQCGTPLSFEYHESENMDLAVGSLDHPELVRPVMHVGVESRIANFWVEDGLPQRRIGEFEHIAKKWKTAYGDDVQPGPRK